MKIPQEVENNCTVELRPEDPDKYQVTVFFREPGRWSHGKFHF